MTTRINNKISTSQKQSGRLVVNELMEEKLNLISVDTGTPVSIMYPDVVGYFQLVGVHIYGGLPQEDL